jgi:transcriptional regulator with XRE-family HTH domain
MDPVQLGARLREARVQSRRSLRTVANVVGVSASMLSQVETGKTLPSVSTLYALVSELGVSMDDILRSSADPLPGSLSESSPPLPVGGSIVKDGVAATHTWGAPAAAADPLSEHSDAFLLQRAAQNPILQMENGVQWERLATPVGGQYTSILVTYAPGASSSIEGRLMRHYGSEQALLLEGELVIQVEFEVYTMTAGTSIFLNSQRPHMYMNKSDQVARGVWFVTSRRVDENVPPPVTDLINTAHAGAGPRDAVDVLRAFGTAPIRA